MRKILKITLIILIALIIAAAVLAISAFLKYKSVEKQNIVPAIVKTETNPMTDNITLGNSLQIEYEIKSPWNKKPLEADVSPGKGSQTVGNPGFVKMKTRWGYNIWKMLLKVQPYLTGNIPEGKGKIKFSPGIDDKIDQINFNIPAFTSTEIPNVKDKLSVAGRVKPESQIRKAKHRYYWLAAILTILILAALIYRFFIRKAKEQAMPLTSWALALLSLSELNENFNSGNLSTVKCISKLTDIVRNYLENRFSIHAPRQTTNEFLRKMEDRNSPLNNQDKNFLKEFMVSADMVKFAKCDASKAQVETAIERAIQLVDETTPNQNTTNKAEHSTYR